MRIADDGLGADGLSTRALHFTRYPARVSIAHPSDGAVSHETDPIEMPTSMSCRRLPALAAPWGFRLPGRTAGGLLLLAICADAPARVADLVDLSIEELTQVPITSISRRPEPLATAASAVQIITGEEVRRSGASILPEALRLAPNLQVKQITSNDWAVTSRGFISIRTETGTLANKLLVMIDGRAIYTPVFGGVFWDARNLLLDDIDRIEVVSGPGGTLWGANAVNGVVHLIRRPASQTQGWYGNVTVGALIEDYSLRYGGKIGDSGHYRVYGQQLKRDALAADGSDDWIMYQSGFRMDLSPTSRDQLTLQGDIHSGEEGRSTELGINGHNLMAIWNHEQSDDSQWRLSTYIDRRDRELSFLDLEEKIFDIELQHRYRANASTNLVWGADYRSYADWSVGRQTPYLMPEHRRLSSVNAFVQGEFALRPDKLLLTAGTKLSDSEYGGFGFQPSVRLAWRLSDNGTLWSAISRAIRSPTRIDRDLATGELRGNPDFHNESVIAYELGYRCQPTPRISLSIATHYDRYRGLRSININPGPPPQLIYANGLDVESWGAELFGMFAITDRWRLRAFYSYLRSDFEANSPAVTGDVDLAGDRDSKYMAGLHSMMDLGGGFQFDIFMRRVGAIGPGPVLGDPGTPAHNNLDIRLAWQNKHWEIALIGQNVNGAQTEFGPEAIPRYVFLRTRFWY
jgi:iron complex outermembrane receptor protein